MKIRNNGVKLSTLSSEPFGCCHLWRECNFGKRGCCNVDYDPNYAKLCASFNRNRGIRQEEAWIDETTSTTIKEEDLTVSFELDENGQFILF